MNKRILYSGLTILTTLSFMGAGTFAYFNDQASSQTNTFATGTLNVTVDQDGQSLTPVTNWAPGETATVLFDVNNVGTLPVYLKAFATGAWVDGGDASLVKVTTVERWDGAAWQVVMNNPAGITGEVFYSSNGTEAGGLIALPASSTANFRLTLMLDSTADNSYQGKSFEATLTVNAKQTTAGATW